MALFLFYCLALGFFICFALLKRNEIRYRGKRLPPGTMGWPLFGETVEFLKGGPSFMENQKAKYGSVFKSHILGCPTIISTDAGLNRYILMNEGKEGLVPGYPKSMLDLIGKANVAAVHGSAHKFIRMSLLSLIGPSAIKDQLFPYIDKFMRLFIDNWDGKIIDIQEKTIEMAFYITFRQIVESESDIVYGTFKTEFDKVATGTLSLPISIPGTNYYEGLKARKRLIRILKQIMAERRVSLRNHNDMLAELLGNENTKYNLNDEQIYDQVFTLLYSGYETVSITTMMAIKYLHDHPKALQELREEHLAIRERKRLEDPIDWNDYKSMSFTRAVILETSRLATVVNGVLRKTTQDAELNGFIIPKGWRIYVYTRELNYDPLLYPEPFTFNPWRWLGKSLESHGHFFLFGAGIRLCPGKELGLVKISTFLHYFVTRYRWEEVGECKILKFPRVEVPNGLHIRVSKY
ncbi:cytochrome P450 85A-like [Alnus glutinosa]|uniref:cytochrome P450 85A-like n=1 Tax=Alnus glutinosa TaxID=3517 RepID=UPI002D7898B3|nr:cytochrome P450 85A-like [Alnus glutinosa]